MIVALGAVLLGGVAACQVIRSVATGMTTAYASGPDASVQATLRQLHRGMSEPQVQAAIGPPDSVRQDTDYYTRYDGALQVHFNPAGKVDNFQAN